MGSIDIHAHAFPESYLQRLAELYPGRVVIKRMGQTVLGLWHGSPLPAFNLRQRLDEMDRDHVDVEVLSVPISYGHLDENSAALCRDLNDFQAAIVEQFPSRFRSFIQLPAHDVAACEAELRRWQDVSSVVGVILGSSLNGIYPGEPAMWPLWELLAEHELPVLIHPIDPCNMQRSPVISPILHWPTETAVAATSMIFSGLLDRFPGVKVILSHYGGPLSIMARRLDIPYETPGFPPSQGTNLPRAPSSYLSRFYVDIAQGFHRPAFDAARTTFGIDHLLYGSDHFLMNNTFRSQLNAFLDELSLSEEDRYALLRGNAERLLEKLAQGSNPEVSEG